MIPTVKNPIYGGVATILKFACKLSDQGAPVTLATITQPSDMESINIAKLSAHLEVKPKTLSKLLSSLEDMHIEFGPNDVLIPTAWWTAKAVLAVREELALPNVKVFYFVQDFESLFYPASSTYAEVLGTYGAATQLIINSIPLANFLSREVRRVNPELVFAPNHLFASGTKLQGERKALDSRPLRIVLYGRPSTPRNMFEMALESLDLYLRMREIRGAVELLSLGELHGPIDLGDGYTLRSSGALSYDEYKHELLAADIGMSLMMSPHPSYPPLEMAALGVMTVTNDFLGFKKAYIERENLIVTEPSAKELAVGLLEAECRVRKSDRKTSASFLNLGNDLSSVVSSVLRIVEQD